MSKPNSFEISEKLHSLNVDKRLLERIEQALISHIPQHFPFTEEHIREQFEIAISSNSGELKLNLSEDYEEELFEDGTHKLSIRLYLIDRETDQKIILRIVFSDDKTFDSSSLRIDVYAVRARDKAVALHDSIATILHKNENSNYLFNPGDRFDIFLIMWACMLMFTTFALLVAKSYSYAAITGFVFFLLVVHITILKRLKPYCSFDTNRQKRNDRIVTNYYWLIIITFVISVASSIVATQFIE